MGIIACFTRSITLQRGALRVAIDYKLFHFENHVYRDISTNLSHQTYYNQVKHARSSDWSLYGPKQEKKN